MPEDIGNTLSGELDPDIEPPLPGVAGAARKRRFRTALRRIAGTAAGLIRQTPAASKRFFWFCAGLAVMVTGLAVLSGAVFLFLALLRWLWHCWTGA